MTTTQNPPDGRSYADSAKAAVILYLVQLVRDGLAEGVALGNGDMEFTLSSGEVFRLDEVSITRVA